MRCDERTGVLLVAVLGGIAIGIGAYNAGVSHGLAQADHATQVVRVVGPGFGFPFGLFLFPLFFLGVFALARGVFGRHRWAGPGHEHWWSGSVPEGRRARFEDWHRRQHDQAAGDHPGAGGEPASV
jgi:hypothetical protein